MYLLRSKKGLLLLLVLLILSGVSVWAVQTQRLELRKKAAIPESTLCWNRVYEGDGGPVWRDSCRGDTSSDAACLQVLTPLTENELAQYQAWVLNGKPPIPGCGSPTPGSCTGQPDGTACDASNCPVCQPNQPCPLMPCYLQKGLCQKGQCVVITPTPTPPPGCYYQQVQCIQAPCNPVLVCTSPTCSPPPPCAGPLVIGDPRPGGCPGYWCPVTPTPTRRPTPTPQQPTCTDTDGGRNYYTKGKLTYTNNPYGVLEELDNCDRNALVEGICNSQTEYTQNHERFVCPSGCRDGACTGPTNTPTPTFTPTPTSTPTPTPTPPGVASPIELRLKFAGVTDGSAQGAQVTARFVRSDVNLVTPSFSLNHVGNGVYAATLGFTGLGLPPGPGYSIIIKGEKHVARKFCADNQTAPCQGNQSLTIPSGTLTRIFDFTGLTLDPGDLPPQDGKADSADFDKIKSLLSKPCSSLTDQDKKTADLDYNGCIDIGDAFLMRRTLETRYDEN